MTTIFLCTEMKKKVSFNMPGEGVDPIDVLRDEVRAIAVYCGSDQPDQVATRFLGRLSERIGGVSFYVPRRTVKAREALYAKVRDRFTGGNIGALSIEFGLSARQIRRILSRAE